MWINLLASAGDAARSSDVSPSFVSILRELSPTEATLLIELYHEDPMERGQRVDYRAAGVGARFNPPFVDRPANETRSAPVRLRMPFDDFRVLADNLGRLGLVQQNYAGGWKEYEELTLTPMGHHLVMTCTRSSAPS